MVRMLTIRLPAVFARRACAIGRFGRAAAGCAVLVCSALAAAAAPASSQDLDLHSYRLTYDETFKKLDISAHGPGTAWIAHTPWNGDFGDAGFADPGPGGPFSINAGGLAITARRLPSGKWQSGLICSVDKDGPIHSGFAQEFGYFEMKAILPSGSGTWPAFWLVGTDKSHAASEIDVIEYYGGFNQYFHTTEHVWVNGQNGLLRSVMTRVPAGSLSAGYNLYGVLITPTTTSFYLNRRQFWSTPTPPEYRQPMYLLANLAIGGGWPSTHLASPQVMQIAYIKVFQKIPGPQSGAGDAAP
jgi:hypothetical protein